MLRFPSYRQKHRASSCVLVVEDEKDTQSILCVCPVQSMFLPSKAKKRFFYLFLSSGHAFATLFFLFLFPSSSFLVLLPFLFCLHHPLSSLPSLFLLKSRHLSLASTKTCVHSNDSFSYSFPRFTFFWCFLFLFHLFLYLFSWEVKFHYCYSPCFLFQSPLLVVPVVSFNSSPLFIQSFVPCFSFYNKKEWWSIHRSLTDY